jgi:hypothetical protein
MADFLDPPLEDLRRDLVRLSELLKLVRDLREFGAAQPSDDNLDGSFGEEARAIRLTIRTLSPELAVVSGTLLLFLAGRFEHFARVLFETLCDGFAAKCQRFDQMPDKMRKSLVFHTADAVQSPARYGFDPVQVLGFITTLGANVVATSGLGQINSQCLSMTQNNLTPGVLTELYKRIGINNVWDELAKQASLKTYFGVLGDPDAGSNAKAMLEELMTTRNQIAHPSGNPSFPDPDKVQQFVDYVRVLASVLTDVARTNYAAFAT